MAQFLRPSADQSIATWVDEGGGTTDIFNSIDEVSASDTDYVETANNPSAVAATFTFSTITDPAVSTGHTLRWRYAKNASGGRQIDITLEIIDSTNGVIVTRSFTNITNTVTQDNYTLSASETDNITNYSTLGFRITGDTVGGGAGRKPRVYWVELETPDAPAGANTAGAYHIRKNTDDTTEIPDAGSHITAKYGTEVAVREGSVITYNSSTGVFTCTEAGKYLVIYSDQYGTTSTTSAQPLSVRSRIAINSTSTDYATSIGYIAKTGGSQEYINHSAAILDLAANDTVEIELDRTDSTTSASERPDRIAEKSGITILRLDDSWEYGRYRKTSTQTLTAGSNSITAIDWNTIDEEDANFTLVGGAGNSDIDMATTDVVLAIGNIIYSGGTSDINFQSTLQYRAGANPAGFQDDSYYSNTNGCAEGALTCINIFTPAATGADYGLDAVSRTSSGTITCATGTSLQLLKLPNTAAIFNFRYNTPGQSINLAGSDFNFTTASEVTLDTGSFSHATNADEVGIERTSDYLLFANLREGGGYATGAYAVPAACFRKSHGGVNSKSTWDVHWSSAFNRGTANLDHGSITLAAYIPQIPREEFLTLYADRIGTNSDTLTMDTLSFRGIDMGELFGDPSISHRDEVAVTGLSHIDGTAKANVDSIDNMQF